MKIEHIAIWTNNLERLKNFYEKYFNAVSNNKYINSKKGFSSYFLSFETGTRIEIMQKPQLDQNANKEKIGLTHFAFSVGSKEEVDRLTSLLETNGVLILSYPRTTGDGYYESLIADPDGNQIEITL